MIRLLLSILYLINFNVNCDIYLHNPRGSNNRLAEQNIERQNANRLFDSENNNRGGYNVGNLYYYVGSQLQIEWTNQHSCRNKNSNCEIIIQYMCSDTLRDGSITQSIPLSNNNCDKGNCNTDAKYGMHENYEYYIRCSRRSRNKGIFIADQKVNGQTAMFTRQNPNGQVSGYECSEERDYYPYFQPSPWIDIAILTNNPNKCDYYRSESENVKSRWYCQVPSDYIDKTGGIIPITKNDCEKLVYNGVNGVWSESPSHGVEAPDCKEAEFTRDNHLGNTYGANPPVYNWTIPDNVNENCALRIRYNITTNDYGDVFSESNGDKLGDPSKIPINSIVGLNSDDAKNRGYVFKNNPQIKLFDDLDFKLNLAINTAQYGRVFQDRSHRFSIRKRPDSLNDKKIYNLNVRGKRGNIVQVYPAVEYDFVPNKLEASKNDFIHFQWTGSNTNPPNFAGQGTAGSDRNNLVILSSKKYTKGLFNLYDPLGVIGHYGANYPDSISNLTSTLISKESLKRIAILQTDQFGGSNDELNDAAPYFDVNAVEITDTGVVHYMCTRNNNFSNRDQKGQIISVDYKFSDKTIGVNGGNVKFNDGELIIEKNTFNDLTYVRVDVLTQSQIESNPEFQNAKSNLDSNDLISNYIRLNPMDLNSNIPIKIKMVLNKNSKSASTNTLNVYRLSPDFLVMTKLNAEIVDNKYAVFETNRGGTYVARYEKNYGVIIGAVIGVVVSLIIVVVITIVLIKNPQYINSIRNRARYAHRSLLNKV